MSSGDRLLLERTARLLAAALSERAISGHRRDEARAVCDDILHRLSVDAQRQARAAVMAGQQSLEV